jgi:polyphosphate kinase
MSPNQMKSSLLDMIKKEREKKSDGQIVAKMNALVDTDVIKALYKASMDGVKIDLIIRGICCLRPGIKGVSENIRVRSIIGKYLEHSRIFYFKNSSPQAYISSADWMPRNLEKRFELMVPIYDNILSSRIKDLLNLQLGDNELAWELQSDGTYIQVQRDEDTKVINSQEYLENYINKIYKANTKTTGRSTTSKTKKIFKS